MSEHILDQIAEATGGTFKDVTRLPDGSGCAMLSMPLPKDHWLHQAGSGEHPNEPPMPFRIGSAGIVLMTIAEFPDTEGTKRHLRLTRQDFASLVREAGMYACRASTMNGRDMDFDPEAMLQNLVVGMLGYFTSDGTYDGEMVSRATSATPADPEPSGPEPTGRP
jgi:hypothetical protein